jgi:hypothetical protein
MSDFSCKGDREPTPADELFTLMMGMTPAQWEALGDARDNNPVERGDDHAR